MGLAPWGALGGGNFKTDEQRKSQEGRKMGEASPAAIKISKVLERIANNHKAEITSVALAYVMQKTPYVFPIVGGRKLEHLKGNIAGLSLDLSETDMKDIEEANSFDIGFPMNFLGGPSQSFSLAFSPLPMFHELWHTKTEFQPVFYSHSLDRWFLEAMLILRLLDGVRDPNDIWLMSMAGKQQHVTAPQVCPLSDNQLFGDSC
jgi:hypothetical protein